MARHHMEISIVSLAASHGWKYASLIQCFVLSQSQHNQRLILTPQKDTVYLNGWAIVTADQKNLLKALMIILLSWLIQRKGQWQADPLLLQMCHCKQLDHKLAKKKCNLKMCLLKINLILFDQKEAFLYNLYWALTRLCWKEEPFCYYQKGGHRPVTSCQWTDRPVWLVFESKQRHPALLIPQNHAV